MFGLTPYDGWKKNVMKRKDMWDFDKMFDFMTQKFFNDTHFPEVMGVNDGGMKVDIRENDEQYMLEAEIPGVNKDDVKLELRDDVLTVSVEKDEQINEEKDNYIKKERRYGSMSRSFYVDDVDLDKVDAKFENGVLYVELPKKHPGHSNVNRIPIR